MVATKTVKVPVKVASTTNSTKKVDLMDRALERYKKDIERQYYIEVKNVMFNFSTAIPYIQLAMEILEQMQDAYWGPAGSTVKREDPTQLAKKGQRQAVQLEIYKNIQATAQTIGAGLAGGEEIHLTLLSDEFIGIGKEGDTSGSESIQWLIYFLQEHSKGEGVLVWVNSGLAASLGKKSYNLGRFGRGHLWTIDPEGKEAEIIKAKVGGEDGFADLIFPTIEPQPWFDRLFTEIDFYTLVQLPALEAAKKKVDLSKKLEKISAS